MAEVIGKMCSCDRCGATVFLRCTGKVKQDGGETSMDTFEPYPDEWHFRIGIGSLCPECNEEYEKLVNDFKNSKKHTEGER